MRDSVKGTFLDLSAGLVAIAAVVITAVVFQFVGSDLRALFAVDGVAFFLAGTARPGVRPAWRQALIVSAPGLLGDVALIVNNGVGRMEIPISITIVSIACTWAGVLVRRSWADRRGLALGWIGVVAIALGAWVLLGLPRMLTTMSFHWHTTSAPSLRFVSLDGAPVAVPDPAGRVVVMAFWTTWCLPCRWELPELERVRRRFDHDSRVALWTVDVGWGAESPNKARRFLERMGVTMPSAFDSGFTARALGVYALPSIALVDGGGRLRLTHTGFDRSEDLAGGLSSAITRVIAEDSQGAAREKR
jgi:thiol-disulfide isomerase/thioredoxin